MCAWSSNILIYFIHVRKDVLVRDHFTSLFVERIRRRFFLLIKEGGENEKRKQLS